MATIALAAYDKPRRVIALLVALSCWAIYAARDLRVEADLAALLPGHFPSIQALDGLESRAGARGYVAVVLSGAPQPTLRHHADELGAELEALDSIAYAEVRRPRRWVEDNALNLASLDALSQLADDVEARVDWEIQRHNPLYFDLEEGEPPAVDLNATLSRSPGSRWFRNQTRSDYYEDPERGQVVVLARPSGAASNFDVAQRAVQDVERAVATFARSRFEAGESASLTGRYKKQVDQKLQIQRDLARTSLLSLGLVLAYLLLHFGRLVTLLSLGLPLVLGVTFTFGVVGATFGELNVLTAFIGAILLGLGIDHGIHLMSGYEHARLSGLSQLDAISLAFSRTGKAVAIAALTTVAGFLGLSLSEFRAFHQFGVVASVGMLSILACYAVCLPVLLRLERGAVRTRTAPARTWHARPAWRVVAAALALSALLPALPGLRFDTDFATLQDAELESFQLDHVVNRIVGHSQTPTLILTESRQRERSVARRLREGREANASASTVDMVASVADLLDSDGPERTPLVVRIRGALQRVREEWLENASDRDARDRLLRATNSPPISTDNLPATIARQLGASRSEADTPGGVMVFPAISLSEGEDVLRYARELRRAADGAPIAGEAMVLSDILETVKRESRGVLLFTLLGVLLALLALQRRLGPALIAMACAGLTLAVALGALTTLGRSLNYLNMVVIPVLFGIAVDGAVHLLQAARHGPGAMSEARRAIAASLLTTALGFGTLLLTDHPGLYGLGLLALLGLAANAVTSLVLLPAALELAVDRSRRSGPSSDEPASGLGRPRAAHHRP